MIGANSETSEIAFIEVFSCPRGIEVLSLVNIKPLLFYLVGTSPMGASGIRGATFFLEINELCLRTVFGRTAIDCSENSLTTVTGVVVMSTSSV